MNLILTFGPPGTGKTESDLRFIEDWVSHGTALEEISYVTFMKAAARDGARRFGVDDERARNLWFRTLHSTCFKVLGMSSSQVITSAWLRMFGSKIGLAIQDNDEDDDTEEFAEAVLKMLSNLQHSKTKPAGSLFKSLYDLSRLFCRSADELQSVLRSPHPKALGFSWPGFTTMAYEAFVTAYERQKTADGKMDFVDMLSEVVCRDESALDLPQWRYMVVDEIQDMSPLQLAVVERLSFGRCETVIFSGDDDQCLPGDEPVLTSHGPMLIEKVKQGDEVLSSKWDGSTSFCKVLGVKATKYQGQIIEFITESGRRVRVTPEHHMFVRRHDTPKEGRVNIWKKSTAPDAKLRAEVVHVGDCLPCVLPEGKVIWEELSSMRYLPYEGFVHDLEVEESHNFCASGIFISNCIMGFQGASAQDFLSYRHHPNATTLVLRQTQRFGDNIVRFAKKITDRIQVRQPKDVIGLAGRDNPIYNVYGLDPKAVHEGDLLLHRHVAGCSEIAGRLVASGVPFWNERRGANPFKHTSEVRAYQAWRDLISGKAIRGDDLQYLVSQVPSTTNEKKRLIHHGGKKKVENLEPGAQVAYPDLKTWFTEDFLSSLRGQNYQYLKCRYADYYDRLVKNGYNLSKMPTTKIATIHASKGRQAPRVWLWPEVYPKLLGNGDDEHRIAFVGATRTQNELFLVHEAVVGDWTAQYKYPGVDESRARLVRDEQ